MLRILTVCLFFSAKGSDNCLEGEYEDAEESQVLLLQSRFQQDTSGSGDAEVAARMAVSVAKMVALEIATTAVADYADYLGNNVVESPDDVLYQQFCATHRAQAKTTAGNETSARAALTGAIETLAQTSTQDATVVSDAVVQLARDVSTKVAYTSVGNLAWTVRRDIAVGRETKFRFEALGLVFGFNASSNVSAAEVALNEAMEASLPAGSSAAANATAVVARAAASEALEAVDGLVASLIDGVALANANETDAVKYKALSLTYKEEATASANARAGREDAAVELTRALR